MSEIREPKKANSINKKNRIIDAGLQAFMEKGYYKTNTAEIAKIAGVSTGIVYSYFKDKKDILIYAVERYFDTVFEPLNVVIQTISNTTDVKAALKLFVSADILTHQKNADIHKEMFAMSQIDEDVHNLFMEREKKITESILSFISKNNVHITNVTEKIHVGYNLIDSLCHEYVYHKHDYIDYDYMINLVVDIIYSLIERN